jgi:ATP phosphoribosyltransferase
MAQSQEIRIALPSKGRMESETLDFLAACGLKVSKTNPRQYTARIPALPGVLLLFQRARDISKSVAAGDIDLGIVGMDTLADALGPDPEGVLIIHDDLGFGQCELVTAVPDAWSDVNDLAALGDKAERDGGLRVATKHTNLAQRFFNDRGVQGITLVSADGALEAAPSIGYADFIVDLTSTGTTLHDNHMKLLEDGSILKSTAVLIGNLQALAERSEVLATALQLLEFVEAHLRADGQFMVFANMRGETAEEIAARMFTQTSLGGLQGPTISPIVGRDGQNGWWAVNIVVPAGRLYKAVQELRAVDGSGVIVTPITYIFEESPTRSQRLLAEVNGAEVVK